MEGVGGPAAVGLGIGQPGDDVEELNDRARPAVGDEQRNGAGESGAGVDEVDRLAVDGERKCGKPFSAASSARQS